MRKKEGRKIVKPVAAEAGTPWWAAALLVLAALGAYANTFSVPFFFDDSLAIKENSSLRHLWPPWVPLLPPSHLTVGGRPILNLSFALNYAVSRLHVWSYHAVNLAIHIMAGIVLFDLIRRTLRQPLLRDRFGNDARLLALAIALLWMLHPLQTESVTYISQRAESLMGLFYLLTLAAFIRAAESGRQRARWSIVAVIACFLGMATKEVMATAPVMVLLYDRTFLAGGFRAAWRERWRLYLALMASWVVLAYGALDLDRRDAGFGHGVSPWTYAVTECGVILDYLKLIVWPHPQVIDYGETMSGDLGAMLPQAIGLALLLVAIGVALVRRPALGFAGAWFFVILAVTSSVIPIVKSPLAEHRLYLPLAAPVALAVLGLYYWMGRRGLAVAAALIVACGALTFLRNGDYHSQVTLWTQALEHDPDNARAQANLGYVLLENGDVAGAMDHFQKALALDPNAAEIHNDLGNALWQSGRVDEAQMRYQEALALKPNYPEAHYNLGNTLLQQGRASEAAAQYQEALRLDPADDASHNNLGKVFVLEGRLDDAMAQFRQALEINPDSAEACNNLGNVLLDRDQVSEAIVQYRRALEVDPGFTTAQKSLARAQQMAAPDSSHSH